MFSFKFFSKLSALLLCLSVSSFAVADPFSVTYSDTISAASTSPPYNPGEAFTITIVLDNGGTTTASQTWTSAHIVSITFSMNDAPNTITTVFSPVVLSTDTGSFVSDATGVLTAVPSEWNDDVNPALSTVLSSNDPGGTTDLTWYINDANDVYFTNDYSAAPTTSAGMTNVNNNTVPAFWTNPTAAVVPATAVPTLSQWAMILLSLMLLGFGLVKSRRFS